MNVEIFIAFCLGAASAVFVFLIIYLWMERG